MTDHPLWKYCTKKHCEAFLLSLSLVDIADWTDAQRLECLYAVSRHAQKHYHPVTIARRDGSPRRLYAPDPLLKSIQRKILRNVLPQRAVSPYATAYHPGASTLANAQPHVGQPQILKLDIEAFFPSVTYAMVLCGAFPDCYYPSPVAALLTSLCCYGDGLPQGAPTSPAIANVVMRPFDAHIGAWCQQRGIVYTRYSDDMIFSGAFDAKAVENKARAFLECRGFQLNPRKTKHFLMHQQQQVTGVVVNERPQTPLDYRRTLRQSIHYCCRFGPASHLARIGDTRYLPLGEEGIRQYLRALLGKVGYVLQIRPEDAAFRAARQSLEKLLREHAVPSRHGSEALPSGKAGEGK